MTTLPTLRIMGKQALMPLMPRVVSVTDVEQRCY